ncbi:MAG: IS1595 family transposase [Alphaproteobacteria bacterium]|nr:IS1595 family transposase [Alphaproteobacteria bacterium]
MTVNLTDPVFTDETLAREHLENIRWPDGPVCPHCEGTERVYRLAGKSHRPGLIHCNDCDGSFTVTTGSVMESSHVPLNKWVLAFRLMASSKKGISAHQLHRTIGVTYKTAWFMAHRIREAMRDDSDTKIGGEGETVESDETYWGPKDKDTDPAMKRRRRGKPGRGAKQAIMSLVQRGGAARSLVMDSLKTKDIHDVLRTYADLKSHLMTDEGTSNNWEFKRHDRVKHSAKEYVRYDHRFDDNNKLHTTAIHTNTVEGLFGVFKRGMRGTYQHCGPQHLQRYLDEFDFRYNNRIALGVGDAERALRAIKGAAGKRLTYRQAGSAE